jgi:uncharacterized delta-60 repeat protein
VAAILRSVRWRPSVLAGLSLMLIAAGASGAPGDLDPSFGQGGRIFVNMDSDSEAATALLQQSDGKLLLGRATNILSATKVDLSVARLNPDGTPDRSFGSNGLASTDLPGITASTLLVVQQDAGSIVVAGPAWKDDNPGRGFVAIVRYRADGRLDSTFGSAGFVQAGFGPVSAAIKSLVVQSDGRLVVAGYVETTTGVQDTAFARFNADGSIDATFGKNGTLIVDLEGSGNSDGAYEVMRRSGGGLLAAVATYDANYSIRPPILLALTAGGLVDSSFGAGGRAILPEGAGKSGELWFGQQSDGKILFAEVVWDTVAEHCDLRISRLDGNGLPDPAFATSGVATVALKKCYSPFDIIVTPDDRILFSGAMEYDGGWGNGGPFCPCTPIVMRLTADGARDSAFGENGVASIDLGVQSRPSNVYPSFDAGPYLVQQADGTIVVAVTGEYDDESSIQDGKSWVHQGIALARLVERGASPGLIGFREVAATVPESQASTIYVQRTGGAAGSVSVEFATSDDTAHSGSDYVRTSGTLTWADGDSADKAITIAVTDDSLTESLEKLRVTLSNPTGGTFLAMSQSDVLIKDDDPPPSVNPPSANPGHATDPSLAGGGAVNWAQLLALALVLVATKFKSLRFPVTRARS